MRQQLLSARYAKYNAHQGMPPYSSHIWPQCNPKIPAMATAKKFDRFDGCAAHNHSTIYPLAVVQALPGAGHCCTFVAPGMNKNSTNVPNTLIGDNKIWKAHEPHLNQDLNQLR